MEQTPLYVDLDGTLIKSDLLHESLLGLVKRNPLSLFLIPHWLRSGRAHMKRAVAERVTTPWFWRWIMLVVRTLPTAVCHRTKL